MAETTETQEVITKLRQMADELENGVARLMQINVDVGFTSITKSAHVVGTHQRATVEWVCVQ